MSAFFTGRGDEVEGDGVKSLARAFQHAGARSVVVSLWKVREKVATKYMQKVYENLKAGQKDLPVFHPFGRCSSGTGKGEE